jgi:hypothetical protein
VVTSLTINEVREYLKISRNKYLSLLHHLRNEFKELSEEPEFKKRIYRIYSRGDILDDEFKSDWTIWCKIKNIRDGEGLDSEGKQRVANTSFNVGDLWDIVGITIVCIFPSDIDNIKSFIASKIKNGDYKEQKDRIHGDLKKFHGYQATHYVLGKPDTNIWCEVQIKTMLSDAWSWKTHDVTYKQQGELDEAFRRQMHIIGQQLHALDEQSEIVRNVISQDWQDDKRHRYAACLMHANWLRENVKNNTNAIGLAEKIKDYIDQDISNKGLLEHKPEDIIPEFRKLAEISAPQISARLKLMLSLVFKEVSMDEAMYEILRWKNSADNEFDRVRAQLVQAMTYFSFRHVQEAIECATAVHDSAVSIEPNLRARISSNLAYFYSDIIHSKRGNPSSG